MTTQLRRHESSFSCQCLKTKKLSATNHRFHMTMLSIYNYCLKSRKNNWNTWLHMLWLTSCWTKTEKRIWHSSLVTSVAMESQLRKMTHTEQHTNATSITRHRHSRVHTLFRRPSQTLKEPSSSSIFGTTPLKSCLGEWRPNKCARFKLHVLLLQ